MKYLLCLLIAGSVWAGEPPADDSYKLHWTNIMRVQGVSKDTIALFVNAQESFPVNDSLGTLKANGVRRYVSADGKRGYLFVIRSKKKVETASNGHIPVQYFFEIETIKVFDITDQQKK